MKDKNVYLIVEISILTTLIFLLCLVMNHTSMAKSDIKKIINSQKFQVNSKFSGLRSPTSSVDNIYSKVRAD